VFYHTYPTFIQAIHQAIIDKNQFIKAQKILKPRKIIRKLKHFHRNICKRVYDFLPSHLNLTMSLLEAEEPQPITKTQNKTTYTVANTKILNTSSLNPQQDHTYTHNQYHQQ